MQRRSIGRGLGLGVAVVLAAGLAAGSASAASLCVDRHAQSACYHTIGQAVVAASPGDTITVAAGTYRESVRIAKPLVLAGADATTTVIDAAGRSNGIFIDGTASAGKANTLAHVVVTGFTVENAKFEGILVANASFVTLAQNRVTGNDVALNPGPPPSCPGLPSFETAEGFDCGEGIHLTGVDRSIVTDNFVAENAGGILLSDETGPTNDNLIRANTVEYNPYDCSITLASHPQASITGASSPFGVFRNLISDNVADHNGLTSGEGAGVGLFAPIPGTMTYGNVVIDNQLTNNGLPGIALHSHAPGQNLDNNVISGNYIAGNGPDSDVPTTVPTGISLLGVSPVQHLMIVGNQIEQESIDIALSNGSGGRVAAHLNNLSGPAGALGIANFGAGTVNAIENWWGCSDGPGSANCTGVSGSGVVTTPFLSEPVKSLGTH